MTNIDNRSLTNKIGEVVTSMGGSFTYEDVMEKVKIKFPDEVGSMEDSELLTKVQSSINMLKLAKVVRVEDSYISNTWKERAFL